VSVSEIRPAGDPPPQSAHHRILVVEDEMMIALMIEDMLADMGHEVVGVAQSLSAALDMTEAKAGQFDMAILDVNLAGERSFPVARRLAERGVPFMFATGYGTLGLEEPFQGVFTLMKPFQQEDLARAIDRVAAT
jgi:CheY-like chemotaxis protein